MSETGRLSEEQFARWVDEGGFDELRQILFWRWDPIGIEDAFPNTADEYDRYARALLSRLRAGMTSAEIAGYLLDVEQSRMGCRFSDDAQLHAVADRVVAWLPRSVSRWLRVGDG
jgi:hypothetical protein